MGDTDKVFVLTIEKKPQLEKWHRTLLHYLGEHYGICGQVFVDSISDVNIIYAIPDVLGFKLPDKAAGSSGVVTRSILKKQNSETSSAQFITTGTKNEDVIIANKQQYYKYFQMCYHSIINHLDYNCICSISSDS